MKALVAYFSASGVTVQLAKRLADALEAPIYEIRPAQPYTRADLDWTNRQSRSTVEMQDRNCRPALADTDAPVADADVIFVGYTLQVKDYTRYDMAGFSEEHKRAVHDKEFPVMLEQAFMIGAGRL